MEEVLLSQSKITTEVIQGLTQQEIESLYARLKSSLHFLRQKQSGGDLMEFMRWVLNLQTPSHIQTWASLAREHGDILVVEAARDHGKSLFFSQSLPMFLIQQIRKRSEGIYISLVSYSEDQAAKNLMAVRKTIEETEVLRWLLPKRKSDKWESHEIHTSNGCVVDVRGVGSSYRGRHPRLIVFDDPTKDHWTVGVREQEDFFYGVLTPAAGKYGQLIVVGNPVDKQDLLWSLESNPQYQVFKYPALDSQDVPLWTERYTYDDLMKIKKRIPYHLWMREYMLKRVSSNDQKFKEEWIKYYDSEDLGRTPLYKIMTIDPALSPGGDAMASVITGTSPERDTYVLERMSFRGDFRTGIDRLVDQMVEHEPDFIGIETFAFQAMYKIWLEEEIERRGLHFHVQELGKDSKRSKAARIESLQPKLSHGRLMFLPEHKPLVDQLLCWDPLSKSNDDDEIDALAWQVPLWEPADSGEVEDSGEPKPGTFMDALYEMQSASPQHNKSRLFDDLRSSS